MTFFSYDSPTLIHNPVLHDITQSRVEDYVGEISRLTRVHISGEHYKQADHRQELQSTLSRNQEITAECGELAKIVESFKRLASRDSFVLVLIDADKLTFDPAYFIDGFEGGRDAGIRLRKATSQSIEGHDICAAAAVDPVILTFMLVDSQKTATALQNGGYIEDSGIFIDWISGFSSVANNFAIDSDITIREIKVKDLLDTFLPMESCRACFLAGVSPPINCRTFEEGSLAEKLVIFHGTEHVEPEADTEDFNDWPRRVLMRNLLSTEASLNVLELHAKRLSLVSSPSIGSPAPAFTFEDDETANYDLFRSTSTQSFTSISSSAATPYDSAYSEDVDVFFADGNDASTDLDVLETDNAIISQSGAVKPAVATFADITASGLEKKVQNKTPAKVLKSQTNQSSASRKKNEVCSYLSFLAKRGLSLQNPGKGLKVSTGKPLTQQTPPPCNDYYLAKEGCKKPTCGWSHGYRLNAAQVEALREGARSKPCKNAIAGQGCGKYDCFYGHE